MDLSIKAALTKQNSQLQQQQAINVKRAQSLVLLSRIYIGSINYDIAEDTIRSLFSPFGPIKSVTLSVDPCTLKHKGFCFLEYELPESAQIALDQMNNALFCGRAIKVGRPSNMPNAGQMQQELIDECDLKCRVFVASVHESLSDDDLKMVFEAFGRVVSCRLEPDPCNPQKHRGFGFIEYEAAQSAVDAISGMNSFDLGGKLLRVGPAITPVTHIAAMGSSGANLSLSAMISSAMPGGSLPIPQAAAVAAASITAHVFSQEMSKLNAALGKITPAIPSAPSTGGESQSPGQVLPPAVVIPKLSSKAAQLIGANSTDSKKSSPPAAPVFLTPPQTAPVTMSTAVSNDCLLAGLAAANLLPLSNLSASMATPVPAANPAAPLVTTTAETGWDISQHELTTLDHQENFEIRGRDARGMLMQKLQRRTEEKVVVLRNMVGPDDIDDCLEAEVSEECSKVGQVERIVIYQEDLEDEDDDDNDPLRGEDQPSCVVKIFVVMDSGQSATALIHRLNGRFFGGRQVIAEIYDQHLFNTNDFGH